MPSEGGTRTYSVDWGQQRRPPVPDPFKFSFGDNSTRGRGGAQVNRPVPIGAGIGGFDFRREFGGSGMRLKRGPRWTRSTARTVAKQPRTEGSLCSVRAPVEHWPLLTPGLITCEPGWKGAPSQQSVASSWSVLAITPPAEVRLMVVLLDQLVCDRGVPSPDGGEVR